MFLCCFGFQGCGLGLQNLDLGLRLSFCRLALLLGFLKLGLDLGVELVDLLLKLRSSVGLRLGLLGLHLCEIGFHCGDVLVVERLLYL